MFEFNHDKTKAMFPINDFANICGYFYNAYLADGISYNNGYNCKHPKCEEIQLGVGGCFSWCCPLGWSAEEEDCKEFGFDYEEDEFIITDNAEIIGKLKEE